jgi:hypothetical protein
MSPHLKADLARAGLLEGQGVVPVFINTADAAKLLNISASFLNSALGRQRAALHQTRLSRSLQRRKDFDLGRIARTSLYQRGRVIDGAHRSGEGRARVSGAQHSR